MAGGAKEGEQGSAVPPLFVLGGHRSGAGVVTGLLAEAADLELGDVLPPADEGAGGRFASAVVVHAHNALLASLDRDWTCPPSRFDADDVPVAALAEEIELLEASGRPWGVKDPRLLFLLPAWTRLVPEVRLIGVVRHHEDVVRSLVARTGLEPGAADAIARAYQWRLRLLCDRFDVPVVDTSAGAPGVVGRTRELADALGLTWRQDVAESWFDEGLFGARALGLLSDENVEHMSATATTRTHVPTVSTRSLRDVLEACADDADLDLHLGPRAAARRRRVWSALPPTRPAVELTRAVDVAASLDPVPSDCTAVEVHDTWSLYEVLRHHADVAGVTLPDLASWLPADDLQEVLRLVHRLLDHDGVVLIGLSTADAMARARTGLDPLDVADVESAAREVGFARLSRHDSRHLTVLRLATLPGSQTELAALQQPYDRLRNRRLVRVALRLASFARPLVQFVRSLRARRRG